MTVFVYSYCHSNILFPCKAVSVLWTSSPAHVLVHCILLLTCIKQINKNNKVSFTNLTTEHSVRAMTTMMKILDAANHRWQRSTLGDSLKDKIRNEEVTTRTGQ